MPILTFLHTESFYAVSGTLSEFKVIWIQIRSDVLSVLIWVQTDCLGYLQTGEGKS